MLMLLICVSYYPILYYIGMLFLGGGRASLRRSDPVSTACLLISILPRYPNRTIDNQFHLQPLRHMYTLAVEKRALSTVDIDSDNSVSLLIEVYMKSGEVLYKITPCLLPEMNDVKRVVIPTCIPSHTLLPATLTGNNNSHNTGISSSSSGGKKCNRESVIDKCRNHEYFPVTLDLDTSKGSGGGARGVPSKVYVKKKPLTRRTDLNLPLPHTTTTTPQPYTNNTNSNNTVTSNTTSLASIINQLTHTDLNTPNPPPLSFSPRTGTAADDDVALLATYLSTLLPSSSPLLPPEDTSENMHTNILNDVYNSTTTTTGNNNINSVVYKYKREMSEVLRGSEFFVGLAEEADKVL